jgi:hypothetical protein
MSARRSFGWGVGGEARPARKADILTAICEPTAYTTWESRRVTTLSASTACYRNSFISLYVDDIRTSQEAHAFTACYGDSFSFLYVDDVRTSQEAHAFTAWSARRIPYAR